MSFKPPKGWDRESDTLFIHASGVLIERREYRQKQGWFLIPVDLNQVVLGFDPTPEGRDQAFAAFAKGRFAKTPRKKASTGKPQGVPKKGRKPEEDPQGEDPEEDEGEDSEDTEKTEEPQDDEADEEDDGP